MSNALHALKDQPFAPCDQTKSTWAIAGQTGIAGHTGIEM
jgi:hypothetical protein